MKRTWLDPHDLKGSQARALEAVDAGASNAEWKLLIMWAMLYMEGAEMSNEFESTAMALLVASIAQQRLPARLGKPEQTNRNRAPQKILARFNQLRAEADKETRREDTLAQLAEEFHASDRSIEDDLVRAQEDVHASADAALTFLKRIIPSSKKGAVRQNRVVLKITRRPTATK